MDEGEYGEWTIGYTAGARLLIATILIPRAKNGPGYEAKGNII